jgi:hypothetical protein
MRFLVTLLVAVFSATTMAQETKPAESEVSIAINCGLGFLAKDAQLWKKDHNCASCHHAGLVV